MSRTKLVGRFVRTLFSAAWQSVITWVVIVTAIGAIIALVASQFATIDALRTRNFQLGEATSQASTRYDRLFGEYSKLYDESEQQGVKPSTTKPDDVPSTATPGRAGLPGAAGADGAQGPRGDMGVPGQTGAKGDTGATGAQGATGSAGADGMNGTAGASGDTGAEGPQGATGAAGADGAPGSDGRGVASVSCVATDDGTAFRFTFTDSSTTDVAGACTPPITTPTDPATPDPTSAAAHD